MKERAALYLRVSTDEQTTKNQRPDLDSWVERNGARVVMIEEESASGSNNHRAGRQRIIRAARKGKLDVVVCWSLDRWGRSAADLALTIEEFSRLGVRLVMIQDGLDTQTAVGRLVAGIMGSIAEFERARLLERQRAGIERARAQGKHLGREKNLLDEVEMKRLRLEGKSLREISELMGIPKATVGRRLKKLEF